MNLRATAFLGSLAIILHVAAQTPPSPPMEQVSPDRTSEGAADKPGLGPGQPAKEPVVYTFVEQLPEFPGGPERMMDYLRTNVKYPQEAMDAGIQGKVFVRFVVNADGRISDVTVLSGVPGGAMLDKEAVRAVKAMPNWTPGQLGGKAVATSMTLPIAFHLPKGGK
jgi:TonB family protein